MSKQLEQLVTEKATKWLEGNYDEQTKQQIRELMESDPAGLSDAFYKDLEFGTAGLRGVMGAGTNRMNIYTVGMATQGLANYLAQCFAGQEIKVAIAHDSRNNSRLFAEHTADIFASNGFKVYLFDDLRPTPELSFAIRELGCQSGVVITASHNSKEYNGYKAYWSDGAQITSPHDENIIAEVNKITDIAQIKTGAGKENIEILGAEFDEIYLDRIKTLSLSPEAVRQFPDMKIVYSPMHGAGVKLVPWALAEFGFTNVSMVAEQSVLDGNFPTVVSPNPEERATMQMAIDQGVREKADIIVATDPDADRLAVAMPDGHGNIVLLNGNQTCVLLTYYLCRRWKEKGMLDGNQFIVKTIVTTEMMARVAEGFGIRYYDCLTGFKHIAAIIRENEPRGQKYIGGGEESFGYLPEDFVRDKDAVSSIALFCECTAWAKSLGMSLYDLLKQMYVEYGFYKEGLVNVVRTGQQGAGEIRQMMAGYRNSPPREICGSAVVTVKDYLSGESLDVATGEKTPLNIESSDVLQFLTADGTIISVRPSGTEPKIKFYFGVCAPLRSVEEFDSVNAELNAKIERMKRELDLI
ncbi:MAG: phospho-sugar mutase [Rikenellaceae bacterium]|nr:phospho-sugar mutase [Rikenellaceae bacterium]